MLDGDQAGRRAADAIADRLAPCCALRLIKLAPGMQPDQLPPEAIRELLEAK